MPTPKTPEGAMSKFILLGGLYRVDHLVRIGVGLD
jgi:hypothetical protein